MEDKLDSFELLLKVLEKHLKKGSSITVSDKETQTQLQNLAKDWHANIKPMVDRHLPKSDELYNLDNSIDSLAEYSNHSPKRANVLKDLRTLMRGFRKYVRLSLLKYLHTTPENNDTASFINPENFEGLRKYLSETIRQLNVSYQHLCPDACALLLRKLVEAMLYDFYAINNRELDITDSNGNKKSLKIIINHFIDHSGAKPGEALRNILKDARVFGGTSAHNPRVILLQEDIDKLSTTVEMSLRDLYSIVYSSK